MTTPRRPRVAIFGLLGSGNLGNHGSLDAMLQYLHARQPGASLSCVCAGPEEIERRYGIPAIPINWYHLSATGELSRPVTVALKAFGKVADIARTARWVRRHDVVIVPGMGVLEATLPIRPWGFPYALFLVSLWGKVFGTKVALVSVGANAMRQPGTRWFVRQAARLACYRSFRDLQSRDALREIGVDAGDDGVYPDLAFGLPETWPVREAEKTVGIGVMAYYGTYLDRHRANEIHAGYVGKLTEFVRWLIGEGYAVRLFTGDPADEVVVEALLSELGPDAPIVAEKAESLGGLMEQMATVEVVVASRYHNVVSALKVAKPTISISYAPKNDVLMAEMGVRDFCQPIRAVDVPRLIEQFQTLVARREQVRQVLVEHNGRLRRLLARQEAVLTEKLFCTAVLAAAHTD